MAPTSPSGVRRSSGANVSGLPERLSQLTLANASWIAGAPRAGLVTGGSGNSGTDSVEAVAAAVEQPGLAVLQVGGDDRAEGR